MVYTEIYIRNNTTLVQTLHVDFSLTVVTNEFCIQEYSILYEYYIHSYELYMKYCQHIQTRQQCTSLTLHPRNLMYTKSAPSVRLEKLLASYYK